MVAIDEHSGTMISDACAAHAVRVERTSDHECWQVGPDLIFGVHAGVDRLDRDDAVAAMRLGELLATGLDSVEPWNRQVAVLRRELGW
jgi:hypothetical protein